MSSFIGGASKKVTDVRGFLRDAAGGSSIKYMAEKGCKHLIYIPFQTVNDTDEAGNTFSRKVPVAISGAVHEWQSPDGKFKATVCMQDFVRNGENGEVLNDGTCPFCDRVSDAWDIYNYRKEQEEAKCQLTGEDRKKHLEKTLSSFADERKTKNARPYAYILVVKFRTDAATKKVIIGTDGLPEYDLKVMRLSASRLERIQQQLVNSGTQLPGAEIIMEYPNVDDARLVVSQSTTTPVFPANMQTKLYPQVVDKINVDVKQFDWEGIEKSFPEWAGMTSAEAESMVTAMFEQWDKYKVEKIANPSARYLEYVTTPPVSNPSLDGVVPGAVLPGVAPVMPSVAEAPSVPTTPQAPVIPQAPTAPVMPDPNSLFGGNAGITL